MKSLSINPCAGFQNEALLVVFGIGVITHALMGCGGNGAAGQAPVGPQAPRLVAPLSTAAVTSRRPTLRWQLASGADGAHVQICRDRACSTEVAAFDVSGASGAPASDLPVGVLFWRAYGRSSGVTGQLATPTWEFTVGARSAPVDTSWGTTLDVNGDGYADVIVGAPFASTTFGIAHVYLGSSAGLALSPAVTLTAPGGQYSDFGSSVASAGDVNGDGYGDVIVGANGDAGGVYVYLGSATGLASTPAVTLINPDGVLGEVGGSVASAGDVNGDGYADVIVGAEMANALDGRAYVYLGSATGVASTPAVTLNGPVGAAGYFGESVASAGDVNGDGYDDVIVGAGVSDSFDGGAYLYLGSATGLAGTPAVTLSGPDAGGYFGVSVACAGDVNGDGYADVIVGANFVSNHDGRAYVYLGSASGLTSSPATTLIPPLGGDFGQDVASAGDVNGDGYADVIVGASVSSLAYVYLGGALGLAASPALTLTDPVVNTDGTVNDFGLSSVSAGDVNGDGYADVLVGSSGSDRTYVYLGSASGLASAPGYIVSNPGTAGDGFGAFLANEVGGVDVRRGSLRGAHL